MIVIKVGGGEGNVVEPVLAELAALWHAGQQWVLVHGGSRRTNEVSALLGVHPQFITSPSGYSSRRTDRQTALIYTMVHVGEINKQIVEQLQAHGVNALGLSGLDGRLLEGPRKEAIRTVQNGRRFILRDDYTGTVERVNVDLLHLLLQAGYALVLCPPGISYGHEIMNVDADRAAAAIAAALRVETLILLTGAPGLLNRATNTESLIPQLRSHDLTEATERYAEGRMRHKLLAAAEALHGGVQRVVIAASYVAAPVQTALAGGGTHITP